MAYPRYFRSPPASDVPASALAGSIPSDLDHTIRAERIRMLYRHPAAVLLNVLNAGLVVAVLWPLQRPALLLGWLGSMTAVVALRLLHAHLVVRQRAMVSPATGMTAGTAVTGCLWGALGYVVAATSDPTYQVFVIFVIGGMTAGAIAMYAAYLPAFFAFVIPATLPAIAALLVRFDVLSLAMAAMLTAFVGLQVLIGFRSNRWICEVLRLQRILQEQATHDPLTGLFNRQYLNEMLAREIARECRTNSPLCIAMLDIDHFKAFNDNYGHDAGDAVLRSIGRLLQRAMRSSDIACRYGGEEFVLVFLDAEATGVVERLTRLCAAIERYQFSHQGRVLPSVTVSVGVAQLPMQGSRLEELVAAADHALYAAKAAGRNRIEVYAPTPPGDAACDRSTRTAPRALVGSAH
jgi:diguanylate cyclase (GGDEF)-like protein